MHYHQPVQATLTTQPNIPPLHRYPCRTATQQPPGTSPQITSVPRASTQPAQKSAPTCTIPTKHEICVASNQRVTDIPLLSSFRFSAARSPLACVPTPFLHLCMHHGGKSHDAQPGVLTNRHALCILSCVISNSLLTRHTCSRLSQ